MRGYMELSELSTPIFYKTKSALKIKSIRTWMKVVEWEDSELTSPIKLSKNISTCGAILTEN